MKKIILILILFFIFIISCNKYIISNTYEKSYRDVEIELIYKDVYDQLNKHNLDSIPLEEWITNRMISDTILIEQKIIRKIVDTKTNYTFILSKFIYPSTSYYKFVIRYQGKE